MSCSIKIRGGIDITIEGNSFGLSCSYEEDFNCDHEEGTYRIYLLDGTFGVCGPDTEVCPLDKSNRPDIQHSEVFCDPCKPRCTQTDPPQELEYAGQQEWLFTTYVNGAPSATPILVDSFELKKRKDKYNNYILVIEDKECCCNKTGVVLDDFLVINREQLSIDIKQIVKSSQQQSISGGDDPQTVCSCGCPEGESCGPKINGCDGVGEILDRWREAEAYNCRQSN
jgi:hypothetical protein